jgi:chromate transporter
VTPSLHRLIVLFARYCTLTFGGGNPTVAILQQELVERHNWITHSQYAVCYALSRITPGTNLLAFCTAAGFLIRRWAGAVSVLVASSLPCSIVATVVTYLYASWVRHPTVSIAARGALAAAIGIMFVSCWQLARPYVAKTSWLAPLVVIAGSFVLTFYFSVSPLRVLLLAVAVGWFLPARSGE